MVFRLGPWLGAEGVRVMLALRVCPFAPAEGRAAHSVATDRSEDVSSPVSDLTPLACSHMDRLAAGPRVLQ